MMENLQLFVQPKANNQKLKTDYALKHIDVYKNFHRAVQGFNALGYKALLQVAGQNKPTNNGPIWSRNTGGQYISGDVA